MSKFFFYTWTYIHRGHGLDFVDKIRCKEIVPPK